MKILLFIVFIGIALGMGGIADAQTYADGAIYEPVVEIPGLDPNTQGTDQYVNALYLLAITVAALLAVVKIIFGGVKWMLSDVVTDKSSAKKDMWGAVLGLLIVLSAVLILNTINPNLTKLNFLQNAEPINITLSNQNQPKVELRRQTITVGQNAQKQAFIESCKNDGGTHEVINANRGGQTIVCYAK